MFQAFIIGLGRIAWTLEKDYLREKPASHYGALKERKDVQVLGGWDQDPGKCFAFSQETGVPTSWATALEGIRAIKPQLVIVATWPDSHLEYAQICVQEKIPVVVMEKPLALNLGDAKKILELENNAQGRTRFVVNHERRYSADYLWVKERLLNFHSGQGTDPVLSAYGKLYLGKQREPWKTLLHDGTHLIDILCFLLSGELSRPQVLGSPMETGSSLFYTFYLGAIPLCLEIGSGRDHMVFQIEINTAAHSYKVGNGILEAHRSRKAPWATGFRDLRPLNCPSFKKTKYFSSMMKDAVGLLKNPQSMARSSVKDALGVMEMIQSLLSLSGHDLTKLQEEGSPQDHKIGGQS